MVLRAIIVCDQGASQATKKEAQHHNLTIHDTSNDHIIVEANKEQLATFTNYTLTALDVLIILQEDVTTNTVNKELWPKQAQDILQKNFAVRSQTKEFDTLTINKEYGAILHKQLDIPVQLDNPKTRIVPYETSNKIFLTIAITNKELRKREYRVFTNNTSLRATIAASTLHLAGYTGKEQLLIPYETDGTLSIEAAFIATRKSPHHYEGIRLPWPIQEEQEQTTTIHAAHPSVQFLKASQKNAKIAGVLNNLALTKASFDWLDTKYDEDEFDILVAQLPTSSKKLDKKQAQELASELLYQAKYLLKKNARLAILTQKPDETKPQFASLQQVEEHELLMGKQTITLLCYEV